MNQIRDNVIKCGDYVIIRRTHDKDSVRLIKAETDKPIYLGKQRINLNDIFGQRFGSSFEINKSRGLSLISITQLTNEGLDSVEVTDASGQVKDNRFILDDGKSQKLSKDEIDVFKSEMNSKQIIDQLVKNSSTFDQKTPFAQQKYLKKKQKKYSNLVTILKPNVRLLTEMYFSRGPQKIDYLRVDSLSQMLSHCNVMSGRKYIVLDTNLGILTAAVIERLQSRGTVIQVYTDVGPVSTYRHSVEALNLPKENIDQMLLAIQINEVYTLINPNHVTDNQCHSNQPMTFESNDQSNDDCEDKAQIKDKWDRKSMRRKEAVKALDILKHKDMDGLLFLTKSYDPLNILELMIPLLADSRPFAVFSPYIQPLTECYSTLKKKCVFLRLSETWLRKYQVLTDRTRPEMGMSSSGGYILTGIKVKHSEQSEKCETKALP